jgi:hypothetical protein
VRDHAARVRAAHLGPERRLHVLAERRDRIAREPIHPARHAFDVASLVKLGEPHLMEASFSRLGGREVTGLPFGELIERGVPAPTSHRWPGVNNIMSLLTIDKAPAIFAECASTRLTPPQS